MSAGSSSPSRGEPLYLPLYQAALLREVYAQQEDLANLAEVNDAITEAMVHGWSAVELSARPGHEKHLEGWQNFVAASEVARNRFEAEIDAI